MARQQRKQWWKDNRQGKPEGITTKTSFIVNPSTNNITETHLQLHPRLYSENPQPELICNIYGTELNSKCIVW
jgi:hypothetical protein